MCARETPRREIVHIFRVYPPVQRRVRLSSIESFVLNAATAADEQRRPRKINSCFYKTPIESHVCARERPRGERSFTFSESTYPPAQRRVRLSSIESFVLNAATAADEQRRPRKINSCFYKTPRESRVRERETPQREIVHIFRVYPPAQRRVRLSSIESFVLNAATAADEQRRPRKINSCFYKTPRESRVRERDPAERDRSHFQSLPPGATARATESNRIICIERSDSHRRAAAPAENKFLFL